MPQLTFRPGSTQDPSTDHGDGVHSLLVSDIMQRATPAQCHRALTDLDELRAWLDPEATDTDTDAGPTFSVPDLGIGGVVSDLVTGERIRIELTHPRWIAATSSATLRLWPSPRATMILVDHRGLTESDLGPARELWAPQLLDRLRRRLLETGGRTSPVGVVIPTPPGASRP